MGLRTDEFNDGQVIAINLTENILNQALIKIDDRKDYGCFNSFESFKINTFGNEDILNFACPQKESLEHGSREMCDLHISGIAHQSSADLLEVCVQSSNSSKIGEGDFQPTTVREVPTLYCMEAEEEDSLPFGSKDCCRSENASPVSSSVTESSQNELIAEMQRNIHNLSFDNIHLSDSEVDDNPGVSVNQTEESSHSQNEDETLTVLCERFCEDFGDSLKNQSVLQHSQKFCKVNNRQYFPQRSGEGEYLQLINELCDSEMQEEDELELLSDRSEELMTIENDADSPTSSLTSPSRHNFLLTVNPSSMVVSSCCTPREHNKEGNKIRVVADVEPIKHLVHWEASSEVQLNITEPLEDSKRELEEDKMGDEEESDFQTRQYWSNVGLITENIINPKLLVNDYCGLESIPGVRRVEEKILVNNPQESMQVTASGSNSNKSANTPIYNENINKDANENYLSFSGKNEKTKKKKKFMSRLASWFRVRKNFQNHK